MSPNSNLDQPPPYPGVKSAFESSCDLVIGIDFGTTFTGVAYAHTGTVQSSSSASIADKVVIIRAWPSASSHYAEKTPTVLSYNTKPPTWGGKVRPNDDPQVAYFKLGLQENVGGHYLKKSAALKPLFGGLFNKRTSAVPAGADDLAGSTANLSLAEGGNSVLGGYLSDHNWKHPKMPNMKAVDYASDYLTRIVDHVLHESLPRQFGASFLENQQISYVVTVPAIWSDKAKDLTRQAAVRAGIDQTKLMLITEPEAAALYCATLCKEADLKEGDRFVVCDAGGGTVDLISYKVLQQTPFSIEECSVGTGAACASVYLDQNFESLLRRKLGDQAAKLLTKRRLADSVRHFDTVIKRQYNPYEERCDDEFEIPFAGAQDIPEIGLEEGYLMLSKDDIQSVFDPIFMQILGLVQGQIDAVAKQGAKMKTLFLVGGLGSNLYLYKFLQRNLNSSLQVLQPDSGYSAIMRGAVLYKLGLDFVKERIARRHYGHAWNPNFIQGHHPEFRKFTNVAGWVLCSNAVDYYVKKDQKLENGAVFSHRLSKHYSAVDYAKEGPLNYTVNLLACDDDVAPEYADNPACIIPLNMDVLMLVQSLCTLTVDLRKLPRHAFSQLTGPKGKYYQTIFSLGVTFGAAGIEFRFLYENVVMGTVNCDYF